MGAYWQHSLLLIEQALEPMKSHFDQLDRSMKEAKKHCYHPSIHELTRDESTALFLYTMEGGDNSFYRILNRTLREENRRSVTPWFGYLKLFDTALNKLPTFKGTVWRGVKENINDQFHSGVAKQFLNEEEVILRQGTQLRVKGSKRDDDDEKQSEKIKFSYTGSEHARTTRMNQSRNTIHTTSILSTSKEPPIRYRSLNIITED